MNKTAVLVRILCYSPNYLVKLSESYSVTIMMVQKDELTYFPGSPPGKAFSYPFYSEIKIFPIVFFIYDKRLNDLLIILPIAERKKNKLVTN